MEALIDGARINYIDAGTGGGYPLVFVHGMAFDHSMWRPQIELFSRERRVIAFDMRGHGKSEVGDGQYTYRRFVGDLVGLLDFLEIEKAILCGLSMGGSICIRACEDYPERVWALIACDTTCGPDSEDSRKRREIAIEGIKRDGLGAFADDLLAKVFAPSSFTAIKEVIAGIRQVMVSSSPLGIRGALLAQAARTDLCPWLPAISVPTLLVAGAEDVISPPEVMKEMLRLIPSARMAVIPSAGHVPNLENTPEFDAVLSGFLGEL